MTLEALGLRYTRQRQAIFDYLSRAERMHLHPTAEDVFHAVKTELPKLSLATVYKSLEALENCGLVSKLAAGDGSARYDARSSDHYHLRCLKTGRVEDLSTPYDPELVCKLDPGLVEQLRSQGFHLTGYRLELVGYFDDAAGAVADEARPSSTHD